jgi:hypothetical protein
MPDFPFKPYSVGNLCQGCCENCIEKLSDSDAKCCQSLASSYKECYTPNDCKKCKDTPTSTNPLAKTVVDYCKDPDESYLSEGKTSCCFGECYDNRCYSCTQVNGTGAAYKGNSKVSPKFDPDIQGCCDGTIYSILECKKCENKKVVTTCTDSTKPDCCNGSGNCYKPGTCETCVSLPSPIDKRTHKIDGPCKNNKENPDCCGGTCWNSSKNGCKTCKDDITLIDTPDCGECCGPNNNGVSICCQKQKCCSITNECYDPSCSECG